MRDRIKAYFKNVNVTTLDHVRRGITSSVSGRGSASLQRCGRVGDVGRGSNASFSSFCVGGGRTRRRSANSPSGTVACSCNRQSGTGVAVLPRLKAEGTIVQVAQTEEEVVQEHRAQ